MVYIDPRSKKRFTRSGFKNHAASTAKRPQAGTVLTNHQRHKLNQERRRQIKLMRQKQEGNNV